MLVGVVVGVVVGWSRCDGWCIGRCGSVVLSVTMVVGGRCCGWCSGCCDSVVGQFGGWWLVRWCGGWCDG